MPGEIFYLKGSKQNISSFETIEKKDFETIFFILVKITKRKDI